MTNANHSGGKNKKTRFNAIVIDKDKKERVIFEFSKIQQNMNKLEHDQKCIERMIHQWHWDKEILWGEVNRLKEYLSTPIKEDDL